MASQPSLTRIDSVLSPPHPPLHKPPKTNLPDLCDDVLLIICSYVPEPLETPLKNLSLVTRRLAQVLRPHIFKTLHIAAPLSHLCRSLPAPPYHHAHALKIDMFGSLWWWCSGLYVCASDAIDLFAFIHSLPCLRTLEVSTLGRSLDLFEAAFRTEEEEGDTGVFLLPGVEKLVLTPSASFLVRHCPNLQTLVIRDGGECTVEAYTDLPSRLLPLRPVFHAGGLPSETLTYLSTTAVWSSSELTFLVSTFPNIRTLDMQTPLYTYRAPTHTILTTLSRLPHLHTLHLNRIHKLDVGYRSVWKRRITECRTKEDRMRLWRMDEEARVGAENGVVRAAMRLCKCLGVVWVGGEGVRWMWERRREDGDLEGVSVLWARYRVEKEGVVRGWEVGT